MASPLGRVTASDADQRLLDVALDFDLVGPRRLRLVVEGGEEAFGDQALADAADGACAERQGVGDVRVVLPLVGEQEDACVGDPACSGLALADQALQHGPFLVRQAHTVFFHRAARLLDPGDHLLYQ